MMINDSVFKDEKENFGEAWFFYAEDWATAYGPFDSEALARTALHEYCKECLG
jgi:hypothetical protein